MKLQEGEYLIPDGYSVKQVGRTIQVYKSKRKTLKDGDYRCKDCIHCVEGYSSNSGWYMTKVCEEQPKRMSKDGKRMFYKSAQKYGKPCEHFKPMEKNEK